MDSNIREIVTVQAGHYSNFVGCHWLNLQQSSFVYDAKNSTDINHDFLFREGKLYNKEECYIPRLLMIDSKGSLGSLPQLGTLYEPPLVNLDTSEALWGGKVDFISQSPPKKNDFLKELDKSEAKYLNKDDNLGLDDETDSTSPNTQYNLSEDIKVWSDFLRPHLHSKTVYTLNEVMHKDMTSMHDRRDDSVIWGFRDGVNTMMKESTYDEVTDRIRLLAEACGSLQGFHVLADTHDGMGGVATAVCEHLADDFSSKDVITFAITPPMQFFRGENMVTFYTNIVQTYCELSKFSSVLIPASLQKDVCVPSSDVVRWPHLNYKPTNLYESSALLACLLDCATVPWRSKKNCVSMSHVANLLTPIGRKISGASLSLPLGIPKDVSFSSWLSGLENGISSTSVSGFETDEAVIVESTSFRGIHKDENSPSKPQFSDDPLVCFERYLFQRDQELRRSVLRHISGVRDPLHTTTPFPQLFDELLDQRGFIKNTKKDKSIVLSLPVSSTLYQGTAVCNHLKKLASLTSKIDIAKHIKHSGGLEKEIWQTVLEDQKLLVECYDNNDSMDSDSD